MTRSRKTTSISGRELSVRKSRSKTPSMAMGIEHKLADFFINEFNRIDVGAPISDEIPHDALAWEYLLDIDYNIVDKIIDNRNIKASPLRILSTPSSGITYTKSYIFLELMEANRQYILDCFEAINAYRHLPSAFYQHYQRISTSKLQNVVASYNMVNYYPRVEIVEPFWFITRGYLTHLLNLPDWTVLKTAVQSNKIDDLDDTTTEYLRKILSLTTQLFMLDTNGSFNIFKSIENEKLNLTDDYLYGYFNIVTDRNLIDAHIFSFIINNQSRTIEIFDTNPVVSLKYKYYHMFINNLYEIDYQLEIVNNSRIHLQLVSRSYQDLYCLGWSLIYIYNRLVRDYSVDDFRKAYIMPINLVKRSMKGFENEIKSFLWSTFILLAPTDKQSRHVFFRKAFGLFKISDGVHKNYLYFISLIPKITIASAYY